MRAVLQRVSSASVSVDERTIGQIQSGLLVLLGVKTGDTEAQAKQLAEKVIHLRLFANGEKEFDRSCLDLNLELLVVSQFTLYADTLKGRRPSFIEAEEPKRADALYQCFVQALRNTGLKVETGQFQAYMKVKLVNDGPVTILVEV